MIQIYCKYSTKVLRTYVDIIQREYKRNNAIYSRIYKYVRGLIRGFCPMNLKKLLLEENVGGFDLLCRTIYGVLATLVLATGLVKRSRWKWIVALIAFMGLVSSILRHCTPYSILGISTAKKKKASVQEVYFNKQYFRRY